MFDINTLINEIVVKNNQIKSSGRNKDRFHVSDAGGCYRARVYKRLGVEPTRTIEAPALKKMIAGDASHEKLQQLLRRHGNLVASEGTVETDQLIGHFDAVVKNGVKTLLEIKTNEKWGMGYIKKQGAKKEHKLQVFTYWSLLRNDYKDLDDCTLLYMKREDWEGVAFNFKWAPEIVEQVDGEWQPLISLWENKTLPACSCKELYDGSGPKYCRFGTSDTECCSELIYENFLKKEEINNQEIIS